jgi:hypothetical protein
MRQYGLLEADDTLKGEKQFINNPYAWATGNLMPALFKGGVAVDDEHRGDVSKR